MTELLNGILMGVFFSLLMVDTVLLLMYLMKKSKKNPKKKIPQVAPKQETKPVKEKKDIFLGFRNLFPKKLKGGKEQ
ncbi:MAG: hypothetical protein ABIJ18_04200 [archaeon]